MHFHIVYNDDIDVINLSTVRNVSYASCEGLQNGLYVVGHISYVSNVVLQQ